MGWGKHLPCKKLGLFSGLTCLTKWSWSWPAGAPHCRPWVGGKRALILIPVLEGRTLPHSPPRLVSTYASFQKRVGLLMPDDPSPCGCPEHLTPPSGLAHLSEGMALKEEVFLPSRQKALGSRDPTCSCHLSVLRWALHHACGGSLRFLRIQAVTRAGPQMRPPCAPYPYRPRVPHLLQVGTALHLQ